VKVANSGKWLRTKLADIAEVRTGVAKNEEKLLAHPVTLPYLRVANVQDGHIDLSEIKTITIERDRIDRYRLLPGDVLMTEGGDFDKLGRGAVWMGEIPTCLHQNHVFAVRVNPKKILPQFLALYCASEIGRRYFLACSKQTTNLASINSTQLKEMPVPLPPIDEQCRIVAALDTWDQAIALSESALNLKVRAHRQRLQSLHVYSQYKNHPLGDFVERISTKIGARKALPLTISAQEGLIPQRGYFGKRIASESAEHYTRIKRGEFAYNKSYSDGYPYGAIKRLDAVDEGILSSLYLCFGIKTAGKLDSNYLRGLCDSGWFNRQIQGIAHEGARSHGLLNVAAEDFFAMVMPVPPLERQRQLGHFIEASEAELIAERRKKLFIGEQKRGLMQKLLTGQWRLTHDMPPLPKVMHG
jgi:type I restriction enzyme S subunit